MNLALAPSGCRPLCTAPESMALKPWPSVAEHKPVLLCSSRGFCPRRAAVGWGKPHTSSKLLKPWRMLLEMQVALVFPQSYYSTLSENAWVWVGCSLVLLRYSGIFSM